ncbi:MAG: NAD(P)-binding protein [Eubacteriales bacterium]|nr:NAD(P)-binding protein [Eubacteriales bacterium]
MIRIRQLKLHIDHTEAELKKKICRTLRIREAALLSYNIRRQSLDARRKPELFYIYTVDVLISSEKQVLKKNRDKNVSLSDWKPYEYPQIGEIPMRHRPIIVGSGPAGMFCAYLLAELGYRPILLERGMPAKQRAADVENFWKTGILNPNSNVQFGEGGAGTFSDGKLNTLVKDPVGRNQKVLEIFVEHGAPEEILYVNKPHIGTDVLVNVVKSIRQRIIANGGEVYFHRQVTDLSFSDQKLQGLTVRDTVSGTEEFLDAQTVVLAIGHSARDTFEMLDYRGLNMEPKAFAVGVRIEHSQKMIDKSQYGRNRGQELPAAAYKLTASLDNGRSAYTFCMCPGGYVVNASSEMGLLAVNGMSYHDRAGTNANSAVIVTVRPEDYPGDGPLSGVAFQRALERKAYAAGAGKVPVQLFEDFCNNKASTELGSIQPQIKGGYTLSNVRELFPEEIGNSIELGIRAFDRKLAGYGAGDAILSGVESRTSSPVRIIRDETLQSNFSGLYPCGEGAGYAGGITSAAMDGLKVAEAIAKRYRPFDKTEK